MSASDTGVECDFEECQEGAWYRLDAQWSLVDFDHWYVCWDHLVELREQLEHIYIEGLSPLMETTTLEIVEA